MLKDIFGIYNIRSRISVGIVFLAPVLLHAYILVPEVRTLSSTFVITLITYAISGIIIVFSRERGGKALLKCFPNILPAQQFLLPNYDYIDAISKSRYYTFLKKNIPGFELSEDEQKMKQQTESAVTWLIAQTRDIEKFPLIAEENMNLGFSYNLLGLKPYAICLCVLLILADFGIGLFKHSISCLNIIYCIISTIMFLLLWIFIINRDLVKSCGKKYARALLAACDSTYLNN